MHTEKQLKMVVLAMGWVEKPNCYVFGEEYWNYIEKYDLKKYLLSPEGSRAIQDYLIGESISCGSWGNGRDDNIHVGIWGTAQEFDGYGDTFAEALLDACIKYLEGKDE